MQYYYHGMPLANCGNGSFKTFTKYKYMSKKKSTIHFSKRIFVVDVGIGTLALPELHWQGFLPLYNTY